MAVEKKPVKQPVEKTVVKVNSGESTTMKTKDERRGAAKGKRIAAVVFWLLAIVCEVLAIMVLSGYMYVANPLLWLCIFIVADLALVITGSQFWKKANDVDPVSKQNKVKFFLWNQMGLIVSVIAFFPLVILLLRDKDLDPKTKKIVSIVAIAALVLASAFSIDYNPVSQEEYEEAQQEYEGQTIYWTRYGKSYHTTLDCPSLSRSSTVYEGTIEEAFEANRNDPCDFCVAQ
ncbi:MAG: hypothetical protein II166_10400 [Firmicutes bacterium]|nr:hypothetical protein [Bacillota bacterium]